ncbi:MAG: class I SAM-dependent methyltransferase [Candidatus Hydrogenedentota bacterium]|nr:MAG: class I SAM-dependent methyltransferase [Candidatus Hydrogenedentota bacterium]
MSNNTSAEKIYDKSGCARYEGFVNMFFYPSGIRDSIFRRIAISNEDRILDAGCGYGLVSRAIRDKIKKEGLTGTEQHAFDISNDMLQAFREIGADDINLQQLDVRDLPYDEDYFDIIVTSAMLEYVPEIENALISMRRCLKAGGRIYIFMSRKSPLNNFLFQPFGKLRCHSFKELEDILLRVGFHEIRRRRFPLRFSWLNLWGVIVEATKMEQE